MDKHFTFDDMINTMMPLPISGNANGDLLPRSGTRRFHGPAERNGPSGKRNPRIRPPRHLLPVLHRLIKS